MREQIPEFKRSALEKLYRKYNRRKYVHPDPIEFLYEYDDPADREIVGLIASSLAYGRVAQILASVREALSRIGPSPHDFVMNSTGAGLERALGGFKHRFTTGCDLAFLLSRAKPAVELHGSLGECFRSHIKPGDETVVPALEGFTSELAGPRSGCRYLTPLPSRGSACKRMNLFLRWMIRRDEVDPGGWHDLAPASMLIVPLDTHMHRIAVEMGLITRKQACLKTAVEITEAFRTISPDDPVRYDFALTRIGILENNRSGP